MVTQIEIPELIRDKSPEEIKAMEAKLKRKIDFRLIPMIVIMYIMNNLDRNNIGAAKLAGLPEDLKLKGTEFQLSVSILFVGYLLLQVPSNLFLNKIGKPAVYLPTCMLVWGTISITMAAVQDFKGLVTCRLALGIAEAAYYPGCLFYLSCWYTRDELSFRTALFFSGSLISGAISGLVTSGVTAHMDGVQGLRAWRWLFILEGIATVVIACISLLVLPNFPRTTCWLSPEEKDLAFWRLQQDVGEDDWADENKTSFLSGFKLAIGDIKTYILMVLIYSIVASSTVTNFFPSVVKTLNYNRVTTLLLTAPPFALAVITTYLNAWHSDRTRERYLHIVVPLIFAFASFVIVLVTTGTGPRYFAIVIMLPSIFSGYIIAISWISNSLPQPRAKRAAALALVNTVANLSQVYSSFMYWEGAAPRYLFAMSVNCAMTVIAILSASAMRYHLTRLNKKLDKGELSQVGIDHVPSRNGKEFRFIT